MSQFNPIKRAVNPDYMYYDIQINNHSLTTNDPTPLTFSETRNGGVVPNTGDYSMSIIRFQLDTPSLPVFIPDIQDNQSDPNLTTYSITLEYDNAGVKTSTNANYVLWIPNLKYVNTPPPPSQNSNGLQSESPYYYCYSYDYLMSLINTCFTTAMNSLKTLVGTISTVDPPYMVWKDGLATIYGEHPHFDLSQSTHINIYFNRSLYSLFSSFPVERYDITTTNNRIYKLLMNPFNGWRYSKDSLISGNKQLIRLSQEYSTTNVMSPVSSIVFTTSSIPIVPNQMSGPLVYVNNSIVRTTKNNNAFALVITDMAVDGSFESSVLYNPSGEYRRIDMTGNSPLNNIDIQVYWKNKKGELVPFYLWSGCSCSIKLLFEKKEKVKLEGL